MSSLALGLRVEGLWSFGWRRAQRLPCADRPHKRPATKGAPTAGHSTRTYPTCPLAGGATGQAARR